MDFGCPVRRRGGPPDGVAYESDPLAEVLDELWKKWLEDTIKSFTDSNGIRDIPLSVEADNLERLCGGASDLSCGRFPGYYACDDLADWIIDQIIEWLMDEPELPEEYFWEEVIEEEITVMRRRKHKKVSPGVSRSGRINLDGIHTRYDKPPANISGLVVFEQPYPLYYHPPEASFRGFQRIDGDAVLQDQLTEIR